MVSKICCRIARPPCRGNQNQMHRVRRKCDTYAASRANFPLRNSNDGSSCERSVVVLEIMPIIGSSRVICGGYMILCIPMVWKVQDSNSRAKAFIVSYSRWPLLGPLALCQLWHLPLKRKDKWALWELQRGWHLHDARSSRLRTYVQNRGISLRLRKGKFTRDAAQRQAFQRIRCVKFCSLWHSGLEIWRWMDESLKTCVIFWIFKKQPNPNSWCKKNFALYTLSSSSTAWLRLLQGQGLSHDSPSNPVLCFLLPHYSCELLDVKQLIE